LEVYTQMLLFDENPTCDYVPAEEHEDMWPGLFTTRTNWKCDRHVL